jgi:LacI family transcriptional regulator
MKTSDSKVKVTMAEIADRAGVSKATVSRALGGSSLIGDNVRGHIENVADEMGYVRKTQKRHAERSILTVKVILPLGNQRSTQLFYSFRDLAEGLRDGLLPSGANLIVETYSDHYRPVPHKKGGEIDAFVFAFHRPSSEVIAEIRERGAACVVLNRIVRGVRQVVSDHREALQQIAVHLADRGVTGACCFVSYRGIEDVVLARVQGFAAGCADHGIDFDRNRDSWMASTPQDITHEEVKAWYDRGVRTFVGVNDVVGIILMQHLRTLDLRIPEDVRVTGCDRGPVHEITHPRLTTVDLSIFTLAKEVGRSLQTEIVDRSRTQNVQLVKGALLVGKTT